VRALDGPAKGPLTIKVALRPTVAGGPARVSEASSIYANLDKIRTGWLQIFARLPIAGMHTPLPEWVMSAVLSG
jgi:hypothetical protein